jgi:hypothetical protein
MEAIDIWAVLAMSIGLVELVALSAYLFFGDRKPLDGA